MALKFKPYNPVQHQQQAKERQQKRSAGRSALAPTSTTYIGSLPPQYLVADHKCSRIDKELLPSTNMDRTQDPYYGYPSPEEYLESYSGKDTTVSSAYIPTSEDPLSYTDSAINIQDASSDSSYQDNRYKDNELSQKLLAAIATTPLISELNIRESAFNMNASGILAPMTVSKEQSDTGISPVKHALSSDAKSIPSTASSISTPTTKSWPGYQERASIWINQDSFVDNKDIAQDSSTRMPDLGGLGPTSKDALSGVGLPVLEHQNNTTPGFLSPDSRSRPLSQDIQGLCFPASAASSILPGTTEPGITEPSTTEPGLVKKTLAQVNISSSTSGFAFRKRSLCDSQPSRSEDQSPKRLILAFNASPEDISSLLHVQKFISNVLDSLYPAQSHSLIPDVGVQSMSDTIKVAVDEVGDDNSDDSSSTCSSPDDSESEAELTISQPQGLQHRSTHRRRWTSTEEKLLRRLKSTQKRNKGTPSDCEIASRLGRSENGVKQHWDIMLQKNRTKGFDGRMR